MQIVCKFRPTFMYMKATTALIQDVRRLKKDGTYPVKLRITHNREQKYYPTAFSLTKEDFEKAQGSKPRNEHKDISLKLQSNEKKASDIIKGLQLFTWQGFEKHYLKDKVATSTLNHVFDAHIATLRAEGRIGTAVSYECAQSSLSKFIPKVKYVDVTPDSLRKYERWMIGNGKSITTVGIYLRAVRAIFNNAISEGFLAKELYPFGKRKYEIPTANNVKKALTLKDIGSIYYYQAELNTTAEMAKDYWVFMYLCNGINVKDMCLLRYENIKDNVLEFERAKTSRTKRKVELIRVSMSEDVKRIIEKRGCLRKDGSTFIFPILSKGLTPERERQLIKQITSLINDHMKVIAVKLQITNEVTTYAARHSFATILQRSGASTEFISEALGHSNVRTTQSYLAGFEDESKRETVKALTAFKQTIGDV
jgi:integrase/recombinase XerD